LSGKRTAGLKDDEPMQARLLDTRSHRPLGRRWQVPLLVCGILLPLGARLTAGDWPQILGPTRNGIAQGEQLAASWPAAGPQSLWTATLGSGYAGPAVVGNRVIVFHRVDDQERVEAFDAATGRSLWKTDFEAIYRGGVDPDTGPRCVPLVHAGAIYVYGAAGELHCLALETGKPRWSRTLAVDYGADDGYFGAGSTPILAGGRLLVNVGGTDAGFVGLDPATGKTLWKGTSELASYSSPALLNVDGEPKVVFVTRLNAVLVDPKTGAASVLMPFGKRGPTVNAAVPLIFDGQLFLSASYGVGAALLRLDGAKVKPIWANDESLSSQYATSVVRDGYLYGIHGREDIPPAALRCVEVATGKVMWSRDDFGVAHPILAGDKLLLLGVSGKLTLAEATPDKYREFAAATISDDVTRALPALSGGRLFFRTNHRTSGGKLKCVVVGK
jgi:outer membrane protein assembly factor BamB